MIAPDQLPVPADVLEQTRLGQVLLAGRLVVTLRSKLSDRHVTVQAKCKRTGEWRRIAPYREADVVDFDVPGTSGEGVGNDRIGTLHPPHSRRGHGGTFWPDQHADPSRVWVAKRVLLACCGLAPMDTDQYELLAAKFCLRCGAELKHPDSIQRGVGPECAGKVYTSAGHQAKEKPPALEPVEAVPALAATRVHAPDIDFATRPANIALTVKAQGSLAEVFGR